MTEYFDISFIALKTNSSKSEIKSCLDSLGLSEGENITKLFSGRQIIISFINDEKTDFEELSIGLAEQIFCKETFENDLQELTDFINLFFEYNVNMQYALCSYELNGYLLGRINRFEELCKNDLLKRFPFVYERKNSGSSLLQINTEAQDIFV